MKKIISIFLCLLIYPGLCFSGEQNVYKITDEKSIKLVTNSDQIWDPLTFDLLEFEKQVREYINNNKDTHFLDYAGEDTKTSCDYIRKNLPKYIIEYAGIIKEGKKIIYCNMVSGSLDHNKGQSFTTSFDGGCSLIAVTYDPINKKILSLICNGVA